MIRPRSAELDAPPADGFLVWLLEAGGLHASAYRPSALQRRLSACLRRLRVRSSEEARALLERSPELLPKALGAVLIGVSDFFRDRSVFQHLHAEVLPELLATRNGLRVLSAGCSMGQELYSVAMLLDDLGRLDQSDLLGLDCRQDAIAQARAGLFCESELAGLDAAWRARYFCPVGSRMGISPRLRAKVRWCEADLFGWQDWQGRDLVLFRNVAIYLDGGRAAALWERLVRDLAPGGVLVTGKAERPPALLPLERLLPCIYRRLDG